MGHKRDEGTKCQRDGVMPASISLNLSRSTSNSNFLDLVSPQRSRFALGATKHRKNRRTALARVMENIGSMEHGHPTPFGAKISTIVRVLVGTCCFSSHNFFAMLKLVTCSWRDAQTRSRERTRSQHTPLPSTACQAFHGSERKRQAVCKSRQDEIFRGQLVGEERSWEMFGKAQGELFEAALDEVQC